MKPETKANLNRLIHRIDELLQAIDAEIGPRPSWGGSDFQERVAYWKREEAAHTKMRAQLSREEGARFYHNPPDGHAMKLAGVRSSCTSGWHGLFRNWQNAAVRRITKETAA